MCGIAGLVGFPDSKADIKVMTNAMSHRGPDAEGFHHDDICSLGHRRLSIIDLSDAANQPMKSHCGRYLMVYNGEVYNFHDIAAEIGIQMRTASDTEVILEAFVKWGNSFVYRLNGMFAIAIWDIQEHKLHLFRDRIGVKPLYYFHSGQQFAFASELKAITAVGRIRQQLHIDQEAIMCYLHMGYTPAPYSAYAEIRKFPQGSAGTFSKGQFEMTQWWKPEDQIKGTIISDEHGATEQLDSLLRDSVKKRLISDVPYGTFLSGGIDSSTVTAIAQTQCSGTLNTFSIGFSDSKFNESIFAKKVAEYLGTRHHEFILEQQDALKLITDLNSIYDEPFADSSAIPTLLVSKMAKQHVTMTLSGDGGDELFFGYGAYNWARRLNHPFFKHMRTPLRLALGMGNSRQKRASWLFNFNAQNNLRTHIFSQEQYLFSETEAYSLLHNQKNMKHLIDYEKDISARQLDFAELQALFDMKYYLPDDLLVKVDRASMHFSLETRVPILDYRIAEFALNLSPALKLKNKQTKYLLKQVLFKYVPEHLFERPKWGFSIPLAGWMRNSLNEMILDHIHSDTLQSYLQIKTDAIPAVRKWMAGNDLYYNRIWQLFVLSRFLESY